MGNESKSTCSICVGGPGRLPAPSPLAPLAELLGGGRVGGPGPAWDFEQGRGDLWQASRELKWRVILAGESGRLPRQDILAGHFGAFIWWVILAHLFSGFSWSMKQASFKQRKEKKKKCTISRSVDCIVDIVYSQ
jgi:hypothetical protein